MSPLKHAINLRPKGRGILAGLRKISCQIIDGMEALFCNRDAKQRFI
jgi:hypothetical protein